MIALIAGLLIFLGVHSIGLLAPGLRQSGVARFGEIPWKGLYGLVSLAGFVLLVWGYGQARMDPTWLWGSPAWTRHLTALLVIPAFILLVATYVPGTHIKARVGHPMVLAVKFWAIAHLFSNGTLADLLLFGSFLAWAVVYFIINRRRDRAQGRVVPAVSAARDGVAIVVGLVLYVVFALWAHQWLIGVPPFG